MGASLGKRNLTIAAIGLMAPIIDTSQTMRLSFLYMAYAWSAAKPDID